MKFTLKTKERIKERKMGVYPFDDVTSYKLGARVTEVCLHTVEHSVVSGISEVCLITSVGWCIDGERSTFSG